MRHIEEGRHVLSTKGFIQPNSKLARLKYLSSLSKTNPGRRGSGESPVPSKKALFSTGLGLLSYIQEQVGDASPCSFIFALQLALQHILHSL
jgi:hypothetical protein